MYLSFCILFYWIYIEFILFSCNFKHLETAFSMKKIFSSQIISFNRLDCCKQTSSCIKNQMKCMIPFNVAGMKNRKIEHKYWKYVIFSWIEFNFFHFAGFEVVVIYFQIKFHLNLSTILFCAMKTQLKNIYWKQS